VKKVVVLKQERSAFLNWLAIIKGTLLSLAVSILGSVIIGLVYYFANFTESSLPWLINGLFFLSVFLGAGWTAQQAKNKGVFHGLGVAVLFLLLALITAAVFFSFSISMAPLGLKLILALAAGITGGMAGISLSS
jgi:putative membrane protein (TIGR04086 family)